MEVSSFEVNVHFRQQQVGAGGEESYFVSVSGDGGPGWGGTMVAYGLSSSELNMIYTQYRHYLGRGQAGNQRLSSEDMESLRALGSRLFLGLPTYVQAYLDRAFSHAQAQRLAWQLNLIFEPNATTLERAPWELLHHPSRRFFFALSGHGLTRRRLQGAAIPVDFTWQPAYWLGVWSEPKAGMSLDERRRYTPRPEDGQRWISGPGLRSTLHEALAAGDVRTVHMVAHGKQSSDHFELGLTLPDGQGIDWLSGDDLLPLLAQSPELGLIYLDVCQASPQPAPAGALADSHLCAVVAMQAEMPQAASGYLAHHFYRELDAGQTLSAAMARARRAVWVEGKDPIHWSVPVLYLPPTSGASLEGAQPGRLAQLADWLLDRMHLILTWRTWLGLVWCLLVARLSYTLAGLTPWSEHQGAVILPLWGIAALPLIGAALMGTSLTPSPTSEVDGVGRREWLLFKSASASIYSLMSFAMAGLVWLALAEAGITDWMGRAGRQALWSLTLLFITFFGYLGARHAWRMVYLSLPTGQRRRSFLEGWAFLGLVLPVFWPGLYTAMFFVVPELLDWATSPIFFWIVVGMLLALAGMIYRQSD